MSKDIPSKGTALANANSIFYKKTKPYANILQAKKHFGGIFSNCTNYS